MPRYNYGYASLVYYRAYMRYVFGGLCGNADANPGQESGMTTDGFQRAQKGCMNLIIKDVCSHEESATRTLA